jgi:hypothetical protein
MSETRWPGRNIIGSPPGAAADKETERDTVEAVIKAFTAAAHGRLAFEAALRTYRGRYPGTSEPLAAAPPRSFVLHAERTAALDRIDQCIIRHSARKCSRS